MDSGDEKSLIKTIASRSLQRKTNVDWHICKNCYYYLFLQNFIWQSLRFV